MRRPGGAGAASAVTCLAAGLALALCTLPAPALAQEDGPPGEDAASAVELELGGELRARAETWSDFGFADSGAGVDRDDAFVLGRALLSAELTVGPRWRFFVEAESAVAEDRELPGGRRTLDVDQLDLQQAYAELALPEVTLRLGRQELSYGAQRLVSPLPWSNSQRSWDGALARVAPGAWQADLFVTRYAEIDRYELNDWEQGPTFWGTHWTRRLGETTGSSDRSRLVDLYYLGIDRGVVRAGGSIGDARRHTVGVRYATGPAVPAGARAASGVDLDAEAAWQTGTVAGLDVSAWTAAAEVGRTFADGPWVLRPHLGIDAASGDDDRTDGDLGTFDQLFPLGHAYFGFMDFVGRQNIVDLYPGLLVRPTPKLSLLARLHLFWRETDGDALYNAGGGIVRGGFFGSDEREIGQEIDLVATYRWTPATAVEVGVAHFFAGAFLEETGPAEDMDWAYLQVLTTF